MKIEMTVEDFITLSDWRTSLKWINQFPPQEGEAGRVADKRIKNLMADRDEWKLKAGHANDQIKEIDMDLDEAVASRDGWKQAASEDKAERDKALEQRNARAIERDDARKWMVVLKNTSGKWKQAASENKAELGRMTAERDKATEKLDNVKARIEEFGQEILDRDKDLSEANGRITSLGSLVEELAVERDEWKRAAGDANDQIASLDMDLCEANGKVEKALARIRELKIDSNVWENRARDFAARIDVASGEPDALHTYNLLALDVSREVKKWDEA